MATKPAASIPAHVSPDNVFTLPLFQRKAVPENPWETMVPEIHATLPDISWITNIFPGDEPAWLLKRADDVQAVLRDADNYTKNGMGKFVQSIGEDWLIIPTEVDPPMHTGYRETLNPNFAPQKMASMQNQIRERARDLIAAFKDRGECDFIREFGQRFPVFIVLDLLGLPKERIEQFLEWEQDILHSNDTLTRGNAVRKVKNYLVEEIESRRQNPRDDYITRVLDFESFGRKWTHDEVLGHCFNLYLGGLDTVTAMLGNIFNYLASHPGQQQQLRDDPSKIGLAVEEFLRAFAVVTVFRIATREHYIRDQKIMPGDYVAVSTPVVGRDPALYDEPNEVRFDRRAAHVTLGGGIHKCMGMHLARLELKIAIEEILAALPQFRIRESSQVLYWAGNVLHMRELRLQW